MILGLPLTDLLPGEFYQLITPTMSSWLQFLVSRVSQTQWLPPIWYLVRIPALDFYISKIPVQGTQDRHDITHGKNRESRSKTLDE